MANYVFPLGRSVSTDGTLTGASTNVGDVLYNQSSGALSIRSQDAAGAPLDVAIPSVGGGSGTQNRLAKFTNAAGVIDDSNASDTGATFTIGQAGQWRLQCGYAGGTGWQWLDNVGNTLFDVGPTGKCTSTSDFTVTNGVFLLPGAAPPAATVLTIAPVSGLVSVASDATTTPYTAGVPGNWAGAAPTNVEAAIDRMAALLQVLNGGAPIP
jgi:hypothetical protein